MKGRGAEEGEVRKRCKLEKKRDDGRVSRGLDVGRLWEGGRRGLGVKRFFWLREEFKMKGSITVLPVHGAYGDWR